MIRQYFLILLCMLVASSGIPVGANQKPKRKPGKPYLGASTLISTEVKVDVPQELQGQYGHKQYWAKRDYDSCTNWYVMPSVLVPTKKTPVWHDFFAFSPETKPNSTFIASTYAFNIEARQVPDEVKSKLREEIVRTIKQKTSQKRQFFEHCTTDVRPSDITLQYLTAGAVAGRNNRGEITDATPYWETSIPTKFKEGAINSTATLGVRVVLDALNPSQEGSLVFDEGSYENSFISGLKGNGAAQSVYPTIGFGYNEVLPLISASLSVKGKISAEFERYLTSAECVKTENTRGASPLETIAGIASGGVIGGIAMSLFGGSSSVNLTCTEPKEVSVLKGCRDKPTDCKETVVEEMEIRFEVHDGTNGGKFVWCQDDLCEEPIEISYRDFAYIQLIEMWLSQYFQAGINDNKKLIVEAKPGKEGLFQASSEKTFSLKETTVAPTTVTGVIEAHSVDTSLDPAYVRRRFKKAGPAFECNVTKNLGPVKRDMEFGFYPYSEECN